MILFLCPSQSGTLPIANRPQISLIHKQIFDPPSPLLAMPRERKQRGHRHAEKRKFEREELEAEYLASQERTLLFHDRPMNPFGLLTREEEKYFFEVFDEFKRDSWDDEDAREAFVQNVWSLLCVPMIICSVLLFY
jgi:hypothetical protein